MKARILDNGFFGGYFTEVYLQNPTNEELIKDWNLTEVLPGSNLHKPFWNGTEWIESATPEEITEIIRKASVPETINQMRLRKQLILSGISIPSIYAAIEQIEDQTQRDLVYTMWEYAVVFERSNTELNAIAEMLNISQEQLDEIFINGNLL